MKGKKKRKQAKTTKTKQYVMMNKRKLISSMDGNLYVDLKTMKVEEKSKKNL